MKLYELIKELNIVKISGDTDIDIKGISQNSRDIKENYLFVCIKGFVSDGHNYIKDAIKGGSKAVIVQKDIPQPKGITIIQVKDSRKALAILANNFYGYPSRKLRLIGITGTNGKTTVAYMIRAILEEANRKVGLLTTVENIINRQAVQSAMTTMEALDLQKSFCKMISGDTEFCVMEVSSHSLSLSRVDGCDFDTAIFTNISDEHFEVHKNFQNYLDSKKKLFQLLNLTDNNTGQKRKTGIVNIDEMYSGEFINIINTENVNKITYAIEKEAMFRASNIKMGLKETRFKLETPQGDAEILLNMSGKYNIYNALAAVAATVDQGISLEIITNAFQKFTGAPGRYKILDYGQPYNIIIDFAHNFHGLEHILKTLELFPRNRIITIFGHGGERDSRVRRKMGQVAGSHSDFSIITADNPRSESLEKISKEIEKGLQDIKNSNYRIIPDRFQAIQYALEIAEENDIVLIAGKGPEKKQIYQDRVVYHNDEEAVRQILKEKG